MPSAIQLEITRAITKQIWWGNNERYPKGEDCCDSELATHFQQVSETICFSIILHPSYVIVLNFIFVSSHTSFDSWLLTPTRFVSFVRHANVDLVARWGRRASPQKNRKRLPSNKCTVLRSYCATTTQVIYTPVPQPAYLSPFHQIHHQPRPAFVSR